jgi:putative hydrolase of the HAD superfamily
MRRSPPAFLYFDLGNVVLTFDYEVACRQMGEVAGLPAHVIREVVYDTGLENAYERGDLTSEQFYEIFCQRSDTRPDMHKLLRASSDMFELNEAVVAILPQLRAAGQRLGLLSNTCEAHWDFCLNKRFPILRECFEVTALSFQLRSLKPEPEIYRQAADMAGVSPSQVFFVDDRSENVAGARRAGFDAVQFTTREALVGELAARGVTW